MENIREIENPCDICLVNTICCRICVKAVSYYRNLVVIDKEFDELEYEKRRDKIYNELIRRSLIKKKFNKAREIDGISKNDSGGEPLQPDKLTNQEKEINDVDKSTGAKILRKIKHFCSNYFKN